MLHNTQPLAVNSAVPITNLILGRKTRPVLSDKAVCMPDIELFSQQKRIKLHWETRGGQRRRSGGGRSDSLVRRRLEEGNVIFHITVELEVRRDWIMPVLGLYTSGEMMEI